MDRISSLERKESFSFKLIIVGRRMFEGICGVAGIVVLVLSYLLFRSLSGKGVLLTLAYIDPLRPAKSPKLLQCGGASRAAIVQRTPLS